MKTASYISTQTTTGGVGKYPLSTQALDFIQSQILLLQNLSLIGGNRYILKAPDGTSTGCVVIDGEVFTLPASPAMSDRMKYVVVKTEKQDITADGETYKDARTVRTAALSPTKSESEAYEINQFNNFATNTALNAQIKQMPETVLKYLQDVMEQKLSSLSVTGLTQSQLDNLRTPCLVSCDKSVTMFGSTRYSVFVRKMGTAIQQELTLPDNTKYVRLGYEEDGWEGAWEKVTENLHIEAKIVRGTVYLRHGYLPADASIVLLRKKKRSKFRRTGGSNAYTQNRGKREKRQPKTQYVHYKGIVLSMGEANKWYVPKCVEVADKAVDGNLIDRELSTLCNSLIKEVSSENGVRVFKVQGMRNKVAEGKAKGRQTTGYVSIAIQAAHYASNGSKDAGGEMVRMKYRIARKRPKSEDGTFGKTVWYRSFSME